MSSSFRVHFTILRLLPLFVIGAVGLSGQGTPSGAAPGTSAQVVMSPFEVRSPQDYGYRAGASVTEHYEGKDSLLYRNTTLAGWQRSCAGIAPLIPAVHTPTQDLQALLDAGVAYVVVHPPYAKSGCASVVTRRLGEPVARTPRAVVWDLTQAPDLQVSAPPRASAVREKAP
jgi:hypothetical protein